MKISTKEVKSVKSGMYTIQLVYNFVSVLMSGKLRKIPLPF